MKYILYCRKSTEDKKKQVLSLPAQKRTLKKLANERGLNIVSMYEESMSAKDPGRPAFNQMMNEIKSGKADAILT